VTARGNAKQAIFVDDQDRHRFVDLLAKEVEQQRWLLSAWCLMDIHNHVMFETTEPNLVAGMRRLNPGKQLDSRKCLHLGYPAFKWR
jgi:REP element-mobilizing transposase RayT